MIALPIILVGPAEEAGMKVPEDIDNYDAKRYPHWHVFYHRSWVYLCPFQIAIGIMRE